MSKIDKINVDGTVYDVAPGDGTVGTAEIADGTVTTAKLADGAASGVKLAAATSTARGGVKVGSGLSVTSDGTLSATGYTLPAATTSKLGGVSVSTGLSVTTAGALSVKAATASAIGGVKPSTGLSVTSAGALSVKAATTSSLGGVSVGSGLSVTTAGALSVAVTTILQAVYPVGSVYANYSNSTNPATLLGFGTWAAIGGRFLLGADSAYTAGSTGGEAEHTLTVDEIPSHRHGYTAPSRNSGTEWIGEYGTGASQQLNSDYAGGGGAHNNMPPYVAVYLWRRTA